MAIAQRHGIRAEPLNGDELRQIYPEIAPSVTRGLLIPGNAFTVSPQRLVQTSRENSWSPPAETIIAERAMKIIPKAAPTGS